MELSGDDPFVVGIQNHEVLRSFGRNVITTGEVTAIEQNRSISFRSLSGPVPVKEPRSFQAVGDQTKLTFHLEGELDAFYSILWIFMSGASRRKMADSLDKRKGLLEDQRQ